MKYAFIPPGHKGDLTMAPLRALQQFVNTSKSTSASKRRFCNLNFLPTAESPVIFTAIIERPDRIPLSLMLSLELCLTQTLCRIMAGMISLKRTVPPMNELSRVLCSKLSNKQKGLETLSISA